VSCEACADAFLVAADRNYGECAGGISTLDRVIVATPASLTDTARAALVPALYAYWERFFRLTFGEFLRCASLATEPLAKRNRKLARLRVRRELKERAHERSTLMTVVDSADVAGARHSLTQARDALDNVDQLFDVPLQFDDPEQWLAIDANVRYEIIEENCKRFGLDATRLKDLVDGARWKLYPSLKKLVDTRNEIAHGHSIQPMTGAEWECLRSFTLELMVATYVFLYEALSDDAYMLAT
jgi:hypothetical protein